MSAHNLPPVSEFRTNVTPESMHGKSSLVVRASLGVSKNAKILAMVLVGWHWPLPQMKVSIATSLSFSPLKASGSCYFPIEAKILSPMDSVPDLPAALVEAGLLCSCVHHPFFWMTQEIVLSSKGILLMARGAIRAAASIMARFIDDSLVQLQGSQVSSAIWRVFFVAEISVSQDRH